MDHGGCHGLTLVDPFPLVSWFSSQSFALLLFGRLPNAISAIKECFLAMKEDLFL